LAYLRVRGKSHLLNEGYVDFSSKTFSLSLL
jgi:hypothetical protein